MALPPIEVNLPLLNGQFEVGIAAAGDQSLPDAAKLHVNTSLDVALAATQAAQYASTTAADALGVNSDALRKWLGIGAYAIVRCGLIRNHNGRPDGDWTHTDAPPVGELAHRGDINVENIGKVVTAVVATKAGFWLMNHHTGQHQMQGYPRKVADMMWSAQELTAANKATLMHTIGHWASTLYILGKARIPGILPTDPVAEDYPDCVSLSADALLRFESSPAGTAGLEVAYQSIRKMLPHPIGLMCPEPATLVQAARVRKNMMMTASKARYHMGAFYLTGQNRLGTDGVGDDCLGRSASFMSQIYPQSTLYKSPKLSQLQGNVRRSKAVDYDDYDSRWEQLCKNYRTIMRRQNIAAGSALETYARSQCTLMTGEVNADLFDAVYEEAQANAYKERANQHAALIHAAIQALPHDAARGDGAGGQAGGADDDDQAEE
ncbi:hypothetical protein [Wenzhou qinvirus-like virus 1]|uniref:Uncharacterized protein n=1 Tax=Wenzhou qinvirus-like virus 1 TaxID=1923647 RepID=A0A1L3KKY9_9VIRU|nr:hypothetical protein [Wenzhou qinvirus-like virus 1]APG78080.1 hypothetical protein [Wenzhou qinvirus-like virus 1]